MTNDLRALASPSQPTVERFIFRLLETSRNIGSKGEQSRSPSGKKFYPNGIVEEVRDLSFLFAYIFRRHTSMSDRYKLFVSYSSKDRSVVEPLVKLISISRAEVFFDRISILPGDRWELMLERNIEKADCIVVFWSASAAKSEWVEKEWTKAMILGKRIIPVALDRETMPEKLLEFQILDFSSVVGRRGMWIPKQLISPQWWLLGIAIFWFAAVWAIYATWGITYWLAIPATIGVRTLVATIFKALDRRKYFRRTRSGGRIWPRVGTMGIDPRGYSPPCHFEIMSAEIFSFVMKDRKQ